VTLEIRVEGQPEPTIKRPAIPVGMTVRRCKAALALMYADMQDRFTRQLLVRHRGSTERALEDVRDLRLMGEYGREFYAKVEVALTIRLTLERESWKP
jgi:hypothetical protein